MTFFKHFYKDESGATAIEYGVIVAVIAGAAVAGISALGGDVATKWGSISKDVDEASPDS